MGAHIKSIHTRIFDSFLLSLMDILSPSYDIFSNIFNCTAYITSTGSHGYFKHAFDNH